MSKQTTLADLLGHQGDAARVAAQVDRLVAGSQPQDDGSMGDFWRDVKAARQAKRASNRQTSAQILQAKGIAFEARNDGAHLIVQALGRTIDFWPGTGLWMVRGQPKRYYGVRRLVDSCLPQGDRQ